MCQLFSMSSQAAATITFSFTGFSERGGRTADHPDGWGIAFYEGAGCRVFHDDQPACSSTLATYIRTTPIKSNIAIAHVRKATQGPTAVANCHPFQREWRGQPWVFAHNGDLRDWRAPLSGPYHPVGTTDSEHAFCWLMQELNARFPMHLPTPSFEEMATHLSTLAAEIATHGNFNFVLSNGDTLFAHCSSTLYMLARSYPFPVATLKDCDLRVDLGPLNATTDKMVFIATEPLTTNESWTALRTGEFLAIQGGAIRMRTHHPQTKAFPVACGLS
jgi:predicted glutamine amidotransferase